MRCDGYNSDSATTMKGRRRRRGGEVCRSFTCISPWFIFWRWFNRGKSMDSRNKFVRRKWEKKKMEGKVVSETGKEASFNIGVGLGLIYLVRDELNKMVELRKRIELLLQNFHTELENQDKEQRYMPSRCSSNSSYSKAHVQEILYADEHYSGQCLSPRDVERHEIGFGSNRFRQEKSMRIDQLEAEFAHLQLQTDGECLLYSQEQYPEKNMEDSAPQLSEEVSDQLHELSNAEFYGVSPRELERKLYEVIEARQQERIDELESALQYAMQHLEEKERELSCWKDAARVISQHVPLLPSLLRQAKQAMDQEFEVRQMAESVVKNDKYKYNIQEI